MVFLVTISTMALYTFLVSMRETCIDPHLMRGFLQPTSMLHHQVAYSLYRQLFQPPLTLQSFPPVTFRYASKGHHDASNTAGLLPSVTPGFRFSVVGSPPSCCSITLSARSLCSFPAWPRVLIRRSFSAVRFQLYLPFNTRSR